MIRFAVLVAFALFVPFAAHADSKSESPAKEEKQIDPEEASLAEAIEDWVKLLDQDSDKASETAAERWAKDGDASDAVKKLWPTLRDRHAEFDYRGWIAGDKRPGSAEKIGDAKEFTVGGHDFGHLHTRWTNTDNGWRIERVFECR